MTKNKIRTVAHKFVNQTEDNEHVMILSGAIGQGSWFYDATSAEDVRNALKDVQSSTIRIKMSSGGGDVFEGIEIYNYLKELDAHVIVEVAALAASAASIIAMGADEIVMKTGSTMMIHEASTFAYGTKSDIQKTMNALEAIDDSIVSIYQQRTGKSAEDIKNLVEAETWFTAEQALENGFADTIENVVEPDKPQVTITDEQLQKIINSVTNNLKQNKKDELEPLPIVAKSKFIF